MKKRLLVVLVAMLMLTAAACSGSSNQTTSEATLATAEKTTVSTTTTAKTTSATTPESTVTEASPSESAAETTSKATEVSAETTTKAAETTADATTPADSGSAYAIVSNNGTKFVKNLKVGWSLGNTFDATAAGLGAESAWCGTKTTEQMIKDIHAAGFETLRLPVSWHNHVDSDFNIDTEWLARVREVADYAVSDGMYVVINIHHDNEKGFMYPDAENEETSLRYIEKIWQQLSAEFASYDEHIVFEGLNEPRLKGTGDEWAESVSSDAVAESIKIIDGFNQKFVDTVRASGGNNKTRYLMVPSYCARPSLALEMKLPRDIEGNENRIIVSVHAYTPYQFALKTDGTDRWLADKPVSTRLIDEFMDSMYESFTSKGIPVIIGECGAVSKDNLEARIAWTEYYFGGAVARGMTCFWWDNASFTSGERFGLYNRRTGEFTFPEIVETIMSVCE